MIITLVSCQKVDIINVSGELKIWHKVTLEIKGPRVSEESYPNPFLDLRLEAEFSHGETVYKVPGYFAADGNAGESGAMNGNSWKVHFNPDKTGTWKYKITFLEGKNIAIADNTENAKEVSTHGVVGECSIEESDKTGKEDYLLRMVIIFSMKDQRNTF